MADEIARVVDVAAVAVEKRRRRALLMESCADAVETLCSKRQHDHKGEVTKSMSSQSMDLPSAAPAISTYRPATGGSCDLFVENTETLTI